MRSRQCAGAGADPNPDTASAEPSRRQVILIRVSDPSSSYALAVDDDPLILLDVTNILTGAGFRPLEAGNVDEALSIFEKHGDEITLLFTDVQMPGDRNGFELAHGVSERWPEVKVLVASGAATPAAGDMPDGAVFVAKPFSGCCQSKEAWQPEGNRFVVRPRF